MNAVDLFAGAGGFSTGAAMAGCRVLWAANHWPAAVAAHSLNHPETAHICQDLHQADWSKVPAHDLLLASPCCQGHSLARGKDRPHHDAARSTAWAVVSAIEYHRPQFALVENVAEFRRWVLFPAWRLAVEALGYAVGVYIRDAADHGVAQNRKRLFLLLSRSKHAPQLRLEERDHRPARDHIRFDAHRWAPIAGKAPRTLARIEAGRRVHGDRFVIPYYGSGSGLTGRSLDRPIGTISTLDRWAVIDGDRMRMLQPDELRLLMGFPADYALPGTRRLAIQLLGNAVCPPVANDLIAALRKAA